MLKNVATRACSKKNFRNPTYGEGVIVVARSGGILPTGACSQKKLFVKKAIGSLPRFDQIWLGKSFFLGEGQRRRAVRAPAS